jgi:hypothetical protein
MNNTHLFLIAAYGLFVAVISYYAGKHTAISVGQPVEKRTVIPMLIHSVACGILMIYNFIAIIVKTL